jgi:mannose-6-phosphate isomerase
MRKINLPSQKIDKKWGYEIIWASTDTYCGKILVFEQPGAKTAKLLHKEKRKSWFINAGRFKFTFVNVRTGEEQNVILEEGKTVDIAEMSPHYIEALAANSMIFETGTVDYEDDMFLLEPTDVVQTPTSKQELGLQSSHHRDKE